MIRVREGAQVVAEVPTRLLTDEAPALYPRRRASRRSWRELWRFDSRHAAARLPAHGDALLRAARLARPVQPRGCLSHLRHDGRHQYGDGAGQRCRGVAGARRARPRARAKYLALTTDGNGRLTYLDPFNGGALAVAEAARNIVCTGATPLALTNCLNFGNPEKPSVYYQM